MKKIREIFIKYMAIIIVIVAGISLFCPKSALWVQTSWINYLLMIIMFGMGLTLKAGDFTPILTRPKDIFCGTIAQYTIMPLAAFVLCYIFKLEPALAAGIILVGTCPGGTASNVITYFAKGDIALSVCMTSVNTLLSPLLTPLITYMLLRTTLKIDISAMFWGIISVVLIPIILGIIANKFFSKFTQKCVGILPVFSIVAICLIIASVVSHNAEKIFTSGAAILCIVILHNFIGFFCGFMFGKILKMPPEKIKAFSIEVGMQNSGLATSLASTSFPNLAMATVPGAIFSVWHNISGALLAVLYRNWGSKNRER